MSLGPAADYETAVQDLQDSYKAGIKAFAAYFAKEWQLSRAEWMKSFAEPPPSDDYIKGYNAGVEAIHGAVDSFLGDYHP